MLHLINLFNITVQFSIFAQDNARNQYLKHIFIIKYYFRFLLTQSQACRRLTLLYYADALSETKN